MIIRIICTKTSVEREYHWHILFSFHRSRYIEPVFTGFAFDSYSAWLIYFYSGIDAVTTGDEKDHHHKCSKEERPTDATSSATESNEVM